MPIIADLQLHSKYARATSNKMDLFEIARWSDKKGINLVATGDWTHPLWFREITTHLEEVGRSGLYKLKNSPETKVRFLLSTEISSIYSQGGATRRVHNLIFSPSIGSCRKIIEELTRRGARLMSDGRPIVGISSHSLLELVLEIDDNCLLIPAHAWTPWFSLYGSKSGFDSIADCFLELSKYIYAIETGLSSDPRMNWQIKDLDSRTILSFSDAHSGPKLGREATVFVQNKDLSSKISDLSFNDIAGAIKQNSKGKLKIGYTIEFFPEEGKYHWSGHRACNVILSPIEIKKDGTICPVCKRELTIGVENRVLDLASRTILDTDVVYKKNQHGVTFVGDKEGRRRPFVSLIPLLEILQHLTGSPRKAELSYEATLANLGTEFDILLKTPIDKIASTAGEELGIAIKKLRDREVTIKPGYDGVFGTIAIDTKEETHEENQTELF